MEKLAGLVLIFPVLMALLFYQYRQELMYLAKSKLINYGSVYDLLIIVPSARDHSLQRQTIRDTWWKIVSENEALMDRVKLKFVLGSVDCDVPVDDRLDEHSCEAWDPRDVPEGDLYAIKSTHDTKTRTTDGYHRSYGQQYITFKIQHPVLLTKLGLHQDSVIDGAKVSLLDAISQKQIVSVEFSSDSESGEVVDDFVYKPVETYLLPKGFEGVIIGDNPSTSSGRLPCPEVNDYHIELSNSSLLYFSSYEGPVEMHYQDIYKWNAAHIPIISFIYTVNDPKLLTHTIKTQDERRTDWDRQIRETEARVQVELDQNGDLLILDLLDTYRNIPQKLLQTFLWSTDMETFHYMLKTDDDCYLNVEEILRELSDLREDGYGDRMWWGHFRHNWAVEVHGKWAEQEYMAPAYPRFACGAGYVISRDIVIWLANNAHQLQTYQGEDISMGIWLAAINPGYVDDPMWQCEADCISDMYATPNLKQAELQQMYTRLTDCGDPCGCS